MLPVRTMPLLLLSLCLSDDLNILARCYLKQAAYEEAVDEEDEDVALGLCRLFTEMGEAYMDVIM